MSYTGKRCTEVIVIKNIEDFDRQKNYQWIAKSLLDDKYYVGYIYVDTPWHSSKDQWGYYLKYQVNTSSYGNQYWEECEVNEDSIRPYTIRNKVWLNDLQDMDTIFVTGDYILDNSEKNVLGTDIDEVIKKLNKK